MLVEVFAHKMVKQDLFMEFEKSADWFHENTARLTKEFSGRFVAVKGGDVVAYGRTSEEVIKQLEKKNEEASLIFIEFVHPNGVTVLF